MATALEERLDTNSNCNLVSTSAVSKPTKGLASEVPGTPIAAMGTRWERLS
jgi:hypothetical protein